MPHPGGTRRSEARVRQLSALLFASVDDGTVTIAEIARSARLGHETVRRLHVEPAGSRRYGPGFFIVAAIAEAQGLSLDEIVQQLNGTSR